VLEGKKQVFRLSTTYKTEQPLMGYVVGTPLFRPDGSLRQVVACSRPIPSLRSLQDDFETFVHEVNSLKPKSINKESAKELSEGMVGRYGSLEQIGVLIDHVAPTDASILITGESGVGKEVIADEIYRRSLRNDKPYVKINCASIPAHLLESELFGYEKGAFTGANTKGKIGLFEYANNGTLMLDGTFTEGKPDIVRNRLPVFYRPATPKPVLWLSFLNGLLYPEDIPTLQEFIGYCLIPSNKGQRMMVIKGNGGEGKSQIGAVLSTIFGTNMKDGSIGKISENRFARADLEHILLCVDDDMRMEALRQTNYVKSIVTAQGKMDLERKGKQSYQGWMFARLLAFSNGDLQALYDRSDGFYRRQLVLTTKEKQVDRADDPDLAEKMKAEAEGIFLWAFEGLQRLVANNFKFTESDRIRENREAVKRDNNNIFDFMDSEGYIRRKADASISSKDFYEIYRMWCEENSLAPLKARSFSDAMIANAKKFNLEHCNNITNSAGRRVWGFMGVEAIARPHINGFYGDSPCTYVPEDIPEEWRQVE